MKIFFSKILILYLIITLFIIKTGKQAIITNYAQNKPTITAEQIVKSQHINYKPNQSILLATGYIAGEVAVGFTLAEILITLLIIGVVASTVIPTLVQDSQDAEFKVAYKKSFAMASLATKTAIFEGLLIPRSTQYDSNTTLYNFNVFKNQFSVAKECMNNNNDQCWEPTGEKACTDACSPGYPQGAPQNDCSAFIDNSGMAWSMYSIGEDILLVDTNGNKDPNRYGKDRWMFLFKDKQNNYLTVGLPYKIGPAYNNDVTSPNVLACHYPPCYYISWLNQ